MPEKSYREWAPRQSYLLAPSPMEWLPAGHLAYFVLDVVEELDLSVIEEQIRLKDARGERPYAPPMMVALLLYGYSTGQFSSRLLARGTYEDVALRVIAASEHPHFTTINQFRLDHWERLADLFGQVFQMCRRAGMVKLGQVALDGTKIKAAASKHKAMSYQRMSQEEGRLRAEVEELLRRAQRTDEEEDRRYGPGQEEEDLPQELRRRQQRLERIRAAKAELEREAAQGRAAELREQAAGQRAKAEDKSVEIDERKRARTRAEKAEKQAEELDGGQASGSEGADGSQQELPLHRVASEPEGKPKPTAQRNFTDPDSRIMVKDGAFIQAYNAQIVVDGASQLIIVQGVSNQSPDQQYLVPMVERMLSGCDTIPQALLADSGYFSQENVEHVEARRVDPYIAVRRETKSGEPVAQAVSTAAQRVRASMAEKLREGQGKQIYARRKAIVEPVFGQIEQARGFRRFSQRGHAKVRCEWAFVCLTHNLLKLFRHLFCQGPSAPLPAGAG